MWGRYITDAGRKSSACVQARQVGGDYYDFLDLGRERLVLVIGDIAGKGIAGALLMANLQATCAASARLPRTSRCDSCDP
jgi:serine phosphatase RsbU (regulator of sigma subunit)